MVDLARAAKRDLILRVLYVHTGRMTPMPMDWVFWCEQVADEILDALE